LQFFINRWIVALTEEDARKQLLPSEKDSKLIQDSDVLDTWFRLIFFNVFF